MRISYSAFDNYSGCPARYKFQYIDRVATPRKIELEFGSLMHAVVENALKRDPIIPSVEELENFYRQGIEKIVFSDELKKKQYSAVGREMIKTFHNSLTPGLRSTIATEKRFAINLNQRHTLVGVIDRIDKLPFGAFEVIDYKTNFKPKTQVEVDRDKQLGIYKIAVQYFWPEAEDIRLSLFFLRTNQKLTTTRVADEIIGLKSEIIQVADKIEKDTEWKPTKNPLCDWCDFGHLCPLVKKVPASEETIKQLASQYLDAYERIQVLEPQIRNQLSQLKADQIDYNGKILALKKDGKLSVAKKNL